MYQAMADALTRRGRRRGARGADHRPAGHLHLGQRHRGLHVAPARQGGSDAMDSPVFRFMRALLECDKPVVAAVTGAAIGIGTTMLLHCDFVYVSDEARLAMPFVSLGLVPEFASSLLVPQLMGHAGGREAAAGRPVHGRAGGGLRHRQRGAAGRRGGEPRAPRGRALQRAAARRGARAKRLMRAPQREPAAARPSRTEGALFASACAAPRRWRPSRPSSRSASPTSRSSEDPLRMSLTVKLALTPLLVAQAPVTRARMPRLPEAEGPRQGVVGRGPLLRLLMAGDSSAAGVGVVTQREALAVHWPAQLAQACTVRVHWQLLARSRA
jgi:enoyl-CoA hydratase/carnithine racemase